MYNEFSTVSVEFVNGRESVRSELTSTGHSYPDSLNAVLDDNTGETSLLFSSSCVKLTLFKNGLPISVRQAIVLVGKVRSLRSWRAAKLSSVGQEAGLALVLD